MVGRPICGCSHQLPYLNFFVAIMSVFLAGLSFWFSEVFFFVWDDALEFRFFCILFWFLEKEVSELRIVVAGIWQKWLLVCNHISSLDASIHLAYIQPIVFIIIR